ncbi:unnamed protein product [Diamesa serratosioi]
MFLFIRMAPKNVFAVARGRQLGIFNTWEECKKSVNGFSNAKFKGFATLKDAENYLLHTGAGKSLVLKPDKVLPELVPKPPKPGFASCFKSASSSKTSTASTSSVKDEIQDVNDFIKGCDFDSDDDMFLNLEEPASQPKQKSPKAAPKKKIKIDTKSKTIPNKLPPIKFEKPKETSVKMYKGQAFNEDKDGFVHVYTDGSCENNGSTKRAKAGLGVFFGVGSELNLAEPVKGRATNNVGEIQASIEAIKIAQRYDIKRLIIFTDSQFLIKSACIWMGKWKTKDWKLPTGKPVANKEDFVELDRLIETGNILIKWSYIPAHKGYSGNEEADDLAKEGAQKYFKD